MDNGKRKVVMAQMKPRERHEWTAKTPHRRRFKWDKRLLRRSVPLAAVFLCIGAAAVTTALFGGDVQAVMSHVTAGFEYDETLGPLHILHVIVDALDHMMTGGAEGYQILSLFLCVIQGADCGQLRGNLIGRQRIDGSAALPGFDFLQGKSQGFCRHSGVSVQVLRFVL